MTSLGRKDFGLIFVTLGLDIFHSHAIFPLLILNHRIVCVLNNCRLILIIRLKIFLIDLPDF
jgi:hypothetical protein